MLDVSSAVFEIFDAVLAWLLGAVQNMIPLFYDSGTGLTFLGVLAICGLALSCAFLVIRLIQNFLRWRS